MCPSRQMNNSFSLFCPQFPVTDFSASFCVFPEIPESWHFAEIFSVRSLNLCNLWHPNRHTCQQMQHFIIFVNSVFLCSLIWTREVGRRPAGTVWRGASANFALTWRALCHSVSQKFDSLLNTQTNFPTLVVPFLRKCGWQCINYEITRYCQVHCWPLALPVSALCIIKWKLTFSSCRYQQNADMYSPVRKFPTSKHGGIGQTTLP